MLAFRFLGGNALNGRRQTERSVLPRRFAGGLGRGGMGKGGERRGGERGFRILPERTQFRGSGFRLFGLGGGFGGGSGLWGSQAMGPRHFLEALEFFEGAVIDALAGIDDPLEALEGGGIGGEGVAGG